MGAGGLVRPGRSAGSAPGGAGTGGWSWPSWIWAPPGPGDRRAAGLLDDGRVGEGVLVCRRADGGFGLWRLR
ncbi:hypothetical protein [Micromonospora sp. ATA51]|uniref:hypothetical protein n=1 Tax=Micromonospora sp. ATA51 TaxID=2806098 RepID=UPI001A3A2110|nr:hypothetical protein [Micromonospora sp. ATA51]MBM0229963.1 hypothetical protein [Micromonospora sp. ATA51]